MASDCSFGIFKSVFVFIDMSNNQTDLNISLLIKQYIFSVVIGTPDPPTNVSASCDILSMTISWRSEFNGGDSRYKMAAKYKNPPIWAKFGFQVDYDVAN